MLSDEQTRVFEEIKDWLNDPDKKIFSLTGAFSTGKHMVLSAVRKELAKKDRKTLLIAPNTCIVKRYVY